MSNICILHLGSNIGDRAKNLFNAHDLITLHIGNIIDKSRIFETEAWGYKEQDDFLNIVFVVSTTKTVFEVLERTQMIESNLGRVKTLRYGPRLIDIDILFYNTLILRSKHLSIPHPRIEERNFVLAPLNDTSSDFVHPVLHKSISELFSSCNDQTAFKVVTHD